MFTANYINLPQNVSKYLNKCLNVGKRWSNSDHIRLVLSRLSVWATDIKVQCVAKMSQNYRYRRPGCHKGDNSTGISVQGAAKITQRYRYTGCRRWLSTTGISVQGVAKITQHYMYQGIGVTDNLALELSVYTVSQRWLNSTDITIQGVTKMI
jgi:hypothetical protein